MNLVNLFNNQTPVADPEILESGGQQTLNLFRRSRWPSYLWLLRPGEGAWSPCPPLYPLVKPVTICKTETRTTIRSVTPPPALSHYTACSRNSPHPYKTGIEIIIGHSGLTLIS